METAIISVTLGNKYFSNDVGLKLLNAHTNNSYPEIGLLEHQHALTDREIEVLKLIIEENTASDIAQKLFISVHTVKIL